jgi:DNA (cytosine-5)-methyltransferase 1
VKLGSLFSGIGGFELAGEWCGHETIWQSEIDPYCVSLLSERFPRARQLGDIRYIDWSTVERPDIITGGFPCQDISGAGKGAGLEGARSGLWFEFARCIREVRPGFVIVENVRRLLTIHGGRDFGTVLRTLAELGYDAEWSVYGASDVGANHIRKRAWILAYANSRLKKESDEALRAGRTSAQSGSQDVSHSGSIGQEGKRHRLQAERERERDVARSSTAGSDHARDPRLPSWWTLEPEVGRVVDGVSSRMDRIAGLGNAIVPACALPLYRRIRTIAARSLPHN